MKKEIRKRELGKTKESMETTSEKPMVKALKGGIEYRWCELLDVRETKLKEMRSNRGINQRYLLDVMCNIMVDIKMQ